MPFKCVPGRQGASGRVRTSSSRPAKQAAPSHLVASWSNHELHPAASIRDPAPAEPPDPPEGPAAPSGEPEHPNVLRSQRATFGLLYGFAV